MTLTAQTPSDQIAASLGAALTGQPLDSASAIVAGLGGREMVLTDVRTSGLATGTEMAPGIRAGDPVALAIFGLRRGFLRPDLRVRVTLPYDDAGRITAVSDVHLFAK